MTSSETEKLVEPQKALADLIRRLRSVNGTEHPHANVLVLAWCHEAATALERLAGEGVDPVAWTTALREIAKTPTDFKIWSATLQRWVPPHVIAEHALASPPPRAEGGVVEAERMAGGSSGVGGEEKSQFIVIGLGDGRMDIQAFDDASAADDAFFALKAQPWIKDVLSIFRHPGGKWWGGLWTEYGRRHAEAISPPQAVGDVAGALEPWKCSRPDMTSYDAMTGEEVTFIYPPGDAARLMIGGGGDLKAQIQDVVHAFNEALAALPPNPKPEGER